MLQTIASQDNSFHNQLCYNINPTEDPSLKEAVLEDQRRFLCRLINAKQRGEAEVGYGPVHFAASLGNVELLDSLLAAGCDKNERDQDGNSPLMWVIMYDGKEDLLDSLVDHGASVNSQNFLGESPLFLACRKGSYSKAQYLLENGGDVNVVNLDSASPLHAAAAEGDSELISLLCKYGAHINAVDDECDSALHWAVREGQLKVASLLVQLSADVFLSNEDGETPLDLAVCYGEKEMVRIFASSKQQSGERGSTRMSF